MPKQQIWNIPSSSNHVLAEEYQDRKSTSGSSRPLVLIIIRDAFRSAKIIRPDRHMHIPEECQSRTASLYGESWMCR